MTQRTKRRYYVRVAGPWACAMAVFATVVDRAMSRASAHAPQQQITPVSSPSPDIVDRVAKVESFTVDLDKRQRDGSTEMYRLLLDLKSDMGEVKGALGIRK